MEFKERLKKLRTKHGLTQEALARKIFVSRSAIAKWEAGLGMPNEESIEALCQVLGACNKLKKPPRTTVFACFRGLLLLAISV